MRHRFLCLLVASLCLASLCVQAKPAPWRLWRSKTSGAMICAANPPGEGWVAVDGPFADPQCQRLQPRS